MKKFEYYVAEHNFAKENENGRLVRSWNSADEYLGIISETLIERDLSFLVMNDDSGIVSTFLKREKLVAVTDLCDTAAYLQSNAIPMLTLPDFYKSTVGAECILLHIPKSLDLFKAQLSAVKESVSAQATLYCAGMTKHLSPHVKALLDEYIGPTAVHKTYKKAVLFESSVNSSIITKERKVVSVFTLPHYGDFSIYPGVFSGEALDNGTRLLLESLPEHISGKVLDLGCGYGVIAKTLIDRYPDVAVDALDISFSALASTALNAKSATVIASNGVEMIKHSRYTFVVSNPPFHTATSIDVDMAHSLFKGVVSVLEQGGTFLLVANRGLNYRGFLSRLFSDVREHASNKRYVVYSCIK